jgi:Tripartite tricarboxylate transporter family receptor
MVHVPYKGTAPALQDLIGGSIQLLVDVPSMVMSQVCGAKIKALAMFSAKRLPSAPEVPTMAEPMGGSPEAAARFLDDEIAKWAKVIAAAGVKAE